MNNIPEPALAVRRLARLVVERHELVPPVDIETLCAIYADLSEIAWPYSDIDGLVHDLSAMRPKVLIRSNLHWRRRRFTVAHELGHVLISWHLGDVTCDPHYEVQELPFFGQEEQADIFASSILLPDQWMGELIVQYGENMGEILTALNDADVSAMAALLGLRRSLFAGWVFEITNSQGSRFVTTPGTRAPDSSGFTLQLLRDMALDEGESFVQEKRIRWFRLRNIAEMPTELDETQNPTDILRSALQIYSGSLLEQRQLEMSLNGKVGGVLRQAAGRPARELFATVEYRLQEDGYSRLLVLPGFRTWLALKARAIELGQTKSRTTARKLEK